LLQPIFVMCRADQIAYRDSCVADSRAAWSPQIAASDGATWALVAVWWAVLNSAKFW
jgi:hypothetical protein